MALVQTTTGTAVTWGNLLTGDDFGFEAGTGNWIGAGGSTLTSSTDDAFCMTRSGKLTCTTPGNTFKYFSGAGVTSSGVQYVFSARFKAAVGKTIRISLYSSTNGWHDVDTVADGTWQFAQVTTTQVGATRDLYIWQRGALLNDVCYWDCLQLEAGSVATPLPTITVNGLSTGNAVRVYDAGGNIHGQAVSVGGIATVHFPFDP